MTTDRQQPHHERLCKHTHVVGVDEAHLDIDLGELGLSIGAQILIAEATHDLKVTIEPRHHQQLLEQLGALRKRVEATGLHTARHQIVARAFRSGARQHRRLDLQEPLLIEQIARRHRQPVS